MTDLISARKEHEMFLGRPVNLAPSKGSLFFNRLTIALACKLDTLVSPLISRIDFQHKCKASTSPSPLSCLISVGTDDSLS